MPGLDQVVMDMHGWFPSAGASGRCGPRRLVRRADASLVATWRPPACPSPDRLTRPGPGRVGAVRPLLHARPRVKTAHRRRGPAPRTRGARRRADLTRLALAAGLV